ncbi:MAG: hypothetical protein M3P49_09610 [Actinomycetota bacterium]|nr:hypothetical protein [Actinomycetota bacterium]
MSERERSLLVWILASAACLVGVLPTAGLGLAVPGEVVLPMSFTLGALFSAVAASWAGNVLFAGDRRRRGGSGELSCPARARRGPEPRASSTLPPVVVSRTAAG